jgi:hypothetical protein
MVWPVFSSLALVLAIAGSRLFERKFHPVTSP